MGPIKAILFEPTCLGDAEGTYEDVIPAFSELKAMGIRLDVGGEFAPGYAENETLYITDNAEGLAKAKSAGLIPILLMHNPDEAMRLVAHSSNGSKPAGGIVSLLELPDFIRFVAAGNAAQL
ncbi:MAG TPA: hypothetical protein VGL82_19130 [Bryobacteraceae bacterium]|jgi:hypothetical protein